MTSHKITVLSAFPDASSRPSGLNPAALTPDPRREGRAPPVGARMSEGRPLGRTRRIGDVPQDHGPVRASGRQQSPVRAEPRRIHCPAVAGEGSGQARRRGWPSPQEWHDSTLPALPTLREEQSDPSEALGHVTPPGPKQRIPGAGTMNRSIQAVPTPGVTSTTSIASDRAAHAAPAPQPRPGLPHEPPAWPGPSSSPPSRAPEPARHHSRCSMTAATRSPGHGDLTRRPTAAGVGVVAVSRRVRRPDS